MAYSGYKEANVEWLNQIPSEWHVSPIKQLANGDGGLFIDGDWIESKSIAEDGIRYITTGNVGPGYYKEQGNGHISVETFVELNCTEVLPGDLLISRLNNPIGRACIIPDLGKRIVTSVDNVILRPNKSADRKYLMYVFCAPEYLAHTGLLSRGATMQRISRSMLGDIRIPLPTMQEQTQIARFLDHQTALIDALIEKKQRLLELLKEQRQAIITEAVTKGLNPNAPMKDSGIPWLGEIPEHWEVGRLKQYVQIKGRIGYRGYTKEDLVGPNEGAYTIGAKHIDKRNQLDLSDPEYLSWEKYHESPEIKVVENDILFTQRGSLGKVCLVPPDTGNATINPSMVILKAQEIHPRFLYFWLSGSYIQKQVKLIQSNTAVPMISQAQLGNFSLVIPSLTEQKLIAEFITDKIQLSEDCIDRVKSSVDRLVELRRSIISEAVTGRIDVRGWKPETEMS